jgi:large subunit ribosomal protein L13
VAATKTYGTRTYIAKEGDIAEKWWLVDASGKTVGRLASDIAMVLMGKHRPTYTPNVLTGDSIVVINCEKVHFSGRKWTQKTYAWFTGYTGQRTVTAEKRQTSNPDRILRDAVRRMLPKNKLATKMLARLKIYSGTQHPHQAQQPEAREMGAK